MLIELSAYGLISGMLREKLNLRAIWSLLGTMIGRRIALLLTITAIYLIVGESYSPLGLETGPLSTLWSTIKQGLPGIIIQLASIPLIIWILGKFVDRKAKY